MGIVYADLRLGNDARPELEEINVTALVETGAHVALQLRLSQKQPREVQTADGTSHLVPYTMSVPSSLSTGAGMRDGALVFGNQVLLGAIPMEDMELIIERSRQQVVNPASPNIPLLLAKGYRIAPFVWLRRASPSPKTIDFGRAPLTHRTTLGIKAVTRSAPDLAMNGLLLKGAANLSTLSDSIVQSPAPISLAGHGSCASPTSATQP
jgi:hypothetical protein